MLDKFLSRSLLVQVAVGVAISFVFLGGVCAQGVGQDSLALAQRWLDGAISNARVHSVTPLRMEVTLGELDSRLKLATCAKVEPYIPVGTRLWGKTRLGLRCTEGVSKWNVFLPVTIKAYGMAWVVRGDVASGTVLSQSDAIEAEVDWAQEDSPIVAGMSQWVGQVATRALTTGQALRQVRVVAHGVGFQIASDGQALSAGVVGQSARVRMDNGRVMSGVVLDGRTVKLEL